MTRDPILAVFLIPMVGGIVGLALIIRDAVARRRDRRRP